MMMDMGRKLWRGEEMEVSASPPSGFRLVPRRPRKLATSSVPDASLDIPQREIENRARVTHQVPLMSPPRKLQTFHGKLVASTNL